METMANDKGKALCTKDLFDKSGTLDFKEGNSYPVFSLLHGRSFSLINEHGNIHAITDGEEGWRKYFELNEEKDGTQV